MDYEEKGGYGKKRSVWAWIGIYIVVALVLYAGIFFGYRELKDNGADDNGSTNMTGSTGLY